MTGIDEVAQIVFVRKRLAEVQYLRATITEEQRQEFATLVDDTVRRIVKQTKINSEFAHKASFAQVGLVEAEPEEGAGWTRILWKADAAVRQEQPRFELSF